MHIIYDYFPLNQCNYRYIQHIDLIILSVIMSFDFYHTLLHKQLTDFFRDLHLPVIDMNAIIMTKVMDLSMTFVRRFFVAKHF